MAELQTRNLVLSVVDLKQAGEAPSPRVGSASVVLQPEGCLGRLYLFGGCDEKRSFNNMHVLDITGSLTWTEVACENLPAERYGHSLHALNDNSFLMFGGVLQSPTDGAAAAVPPFVKIPWSHSGSSLTNEVWIYDGASAQWTLQETVNPPEPTGFHSAVILDNQLIVVGGALDLSQGNFMDQARSLSQIQVLDLSTWVWSQLEVSLGKVKDLCLVGHSVTCHAQKIYLFGGISKGEDQPSTDLMVLDWETKEWVIETPANEMSVPSARICHSFDLVNKSLILFAGAPTGKNKGKSDVYVWDLQRKIWSKPLFEGSINICAHTATPMGDKLLVFGGAREREKDKDGKMEAEQRLSRKLFFMNILEIREGTNAGDYKFKLVSVGDSGVGKSCILTRFIQDFYSEFHVSTIGVDFKTVSSMVKGRLVRLQLWDTAGQERFSVVTGNYYRHADGFLFVFDCTNRQSFEHATDQWVNQVKEHHDYTSSTLKILVGNKYDLRSKVEVPIAEAMAKAEELGMIFTPVSAKTADNIDALFLGAANRLVTLRAENSGQAVRRGINIGPSLDDNSPRRDCGTCIR